MTTKTIPETITQRRVPDHQLNAFFFNLADHLNGQLLAKAICLKIEKHTGVQTHANELVAFKLNIHGGFLMTDFDAPLGFDSIFGRYFTNLSAADVGMACSYLVLLDIENKMADDPDAIETVQHRVKQSAAALLAAMIGERGLNHHDTDKRATLLEMVHGPKARSKVFG